MEYIKTCAYCGKTFVAKSKVAKYCSNSCRVSAYKSEARADARAEEEAAQAAEDARWKAEAEARSRQRWQEVEERADAGDGLAMMETAAPFSVEYFKGFQQYELAFSRQSGQASTCTVNGISVSDPDFAESAAYAVKTDGVFVMRH